MDETETADHKWAGILNGTMVVLLGCAFPTILIWQLAVQWPHLASTWRWEFTRDTVMGVILLLGSLQVIRLGVGVVRQNAAALGKR